MIDRITQSASFDLAADSYDRFRNPYPPEVTDCVISESALPADGDILEIGCGSGRATLQLAKKGFKILAIDPGENLLKIAQEKCRDYHQVNFLFSKFESTQLPSNQFDLVFSADAFHWVDPSVRYSLTAKALREDGRLCLLTDCICPPENNLAKAISEILTQNLDGYEAITREKFETNIEEQQNEIRNSGYFSNVRFVRFPFQRTFTGIEYAQSLSVWSRMLILPEPIRNKILDKIATTIDTSGGLFDQQSQFLVFFARKKPRN